MVDSAPMPGSILIGYDGSASAAHAIRTARTLVAAHYAIVVTVWEPALPASPAMWGDGLTTEAFDPDTAQELNELTSDRAEDMARHGAEIARRAGFMAETESVADRQNVAETLAELAASHRVDAIVIGSHGHGALRARVLGSTGSRLLHHARCPVIVVPAPEPGAD
jgi:nucleotide-binding universal stress UspA family protein